MAFMDEMTKEVLPIWEDCANEKFLNEMCDGTLKKETFYNYMVQDSLYLRDYLKAYAMGIFKCKTLKDMQIFYSVLGFVSDGENATRLKFLADHGMTDADVEKVKKLKENEDYCNFLIETAKTGDLPEIIMAILPCMLGYYHVFKSVKARAPKVTEGYFGALVSDYTTEAYAECCAFWTEYANEKCTGLDGERKKNLLEIYRQASLHELYFWQMAGRD